MDQTRYIGERPVGPGHPVYITAEIGINHNGSLDDALAMIDVAADAGCDAVKFQKRTPLICVPKEQQSVERDTPWGRMTYLDYRYKVEFEDEEYDAISRYCAEKGIVWFASPWDVPSVEFLAKHEVPAQKIASASLTDDELIDAIKATGTTVILSTGMSTPEQIAHAVDRIGHEKLILVHATSSYPAPAEELNLHMINTLQREYPDLPIGYSGHEIGLQTSVAAVALGATFVERHITLDRANWGSDQAASIEPAGVKRLVRDIRVVEQALGDGVKKVYDSERPMIAKLRRVPQTAAGA